jgi:single-stranded DNA-binding protein
MKGIEAACIGVVRKDAELRTAKSGRPWLAIPLAVGEGEDTQYVAASMFSGDLEQMATALTAGTSCYVEGKIKVRLWENDGKPTPSIWFTANVVQPLGLIGEKRPAKPRKSSRTGAASPRIPPRQASLLDSQTPIRGIEPSANERPFDDEIPF